MKKLISLIGLAAVVLFGLSSCKPEEPTFTTDLNTGHSDVGKLYGENGIVESPDDAQGIIFAVSPDGKTAYLVAFTDVMNVFPIKIGLKNGYACNAATKEWSKNIFETGAKDKDGEVNTERIIAADIVADTVNHKGGGSAAQACREYFKRPYQDTLESRTEFDEDTVWVTTKGKWYLPSMEELAALMKVKDKINQKYMQGVTPSDGANDIYFQAIGDKFNLDPARKPSYAYWSSTEYNEKYAWYDLPTSNADSYIPKTWSDERGNGRLYVRPIRKVDL